MARRATLFALFAILIASLSSAQVVAKQGEPAEEYFTSPMVIEAIPVPLNSPTTWEGGSRITLKDNLGRFVCDGVSINSFVIEPGRVTRKGLVPFRFVITLRNRPGHDKLVNMRISLTTHEGEALGAPMRVDRIDVEERRSATRIVKLALPKESLAVGPLPLMKVEITAVDN